MKNSAIQGGNCGDPGYLLEKVVYQDVVTGKLIETEIEWKIGENTLFQSTIDNQSIGEQ